MIIFVILGAGMVGGHFFSDSWSKDTRAKILVIGVILLGIGMAGMSSQSSCDTGWGTHGSYSDC